MDHLQKIVYRTLLIDASEVDEEINLTLFVP